MVQALPYRNITLDEDGTVQEVLHASDESKTRYILEVDLNLPKELKEQLSTIHLVRKVLFLTRNGLVVSKKD